MIWLVFAVMTAVALGALLWPLLRSAHPRVAEDTGVAIYRAQLAEIDDDLADGRICAADAQSARAESARRLILESKAPSDAAPAPARRALAAILIVGTFACGGLLYAMVGSPMVPDAPLAERKTATDGRDVVAAVSRIETHLAQNPDDRRGWSVIAPVYLKLGRADDAVRAYQQIARLGADGADAHADLGEAQVYAAQGVVTADARRAFEAAVAREPTHLKARYYLGLAAEQDGDEAKTRTIWSAVAKDAPEGSPLAATLRERLAALDGEAGQTADQVAGQVARDVAALPAPEQQAAIRGMVDRLAGRLHDTGGGLEEWLRLVRAYRVLNEDDKARATLADARKAFTGDDAAASRLDGLARELGLEG